MAKSLSDRTIRLSAHEISLNKVIFKKIVKKELEKVDFL